MTGRGGDRRPPGALRWLWRLAPPDRSRGRVLLRLGGWSVLEALPGYLSGLAIARALDAGFLVGRPDIGLRWLALLAAAVLVAGCAAHRTVICVADIVEPVRDRLVRLVVAAALDRATRGVSPRHTQPQGTAPRGTAPRGRVTADLGGVARLTGQVETVRESLAGTLIAVRGFVVATVAVLAGLSSLHPRFVVLVGLPLALASIALVPLLRAQLAHQTAQLLAEELLAEEATGVAAGLRDVTACGAEDQAYRLVGRHVDRHAVAAYRSAWCRGLSSLVVGTGGWLPVALLLAMAPALLRDGATPGDIVGAVVYLAHALQPAVHTLVEGVTGSGSALLTATRRIQQLTTPDPTDGTVSPAPTSWAHPARRDELRLCQVSFRYGPHAEPVLHDIDLVIEYGDHLAVVGPSGAGKSTLAGLLCGTLRPTSGRVLLDGTPLSGYPPADLATRRVVIPQQAYVFAGTVRENLSYYRAGGVRVDRDVPESADAADDQLAAAAQALGITALVRRLGGLDAELDPDALSAGERQLIALARAYLSPACIVLLDEATCHLDPGSEARVEEAFVDRPGTLIVVAHRITSALRARRILVLDGAAEYVGDHHSLLRRSTLYRDLVGCWNGR